MRFFYLLLVVIIMIFGVSFAVENNDPVKFRYFVGSVEVALAWLLVLTLALGALLGMLASLGVIMGLRRELRAHKRRTGDRSQAATPAEPENEPRDPDAAPQSAAARREPDAPESDQTRREGAS